MQRIPLSTEAWLELHTGWLEPAHASELESALRHELAWQQRHILLFGKSVLQPRLIAWAGELPYRYSGQTLQPRPWHPRVAPLCQRVNDDTGADFNHVLINRYRDGKDSMGFHSDSEPELGPLPLVASLSLGQSRRFLVQERGKTSRTPALSLILAHGDLLVMCGSCQRDYRHTLPRDRAPLLAERISLTFRRLLCAPVLGERAKAPSPSKIAV